jgi:CheY-like chemotaxis protein
MSKKDSIMELDSKKILIVDDDEVIVDVLTQLFARLGHESAAADNAYSGLNLFRKGQFDIVFTDYDMSGMDGITFAHLIREIAPDSLIILMTGHDRAGIMKQIADSSIDLALFKPFDFLEVVQILQEQQNRPAERRRQAIY